MITLSPVCGFYNSSQVYIWCNHSNVLGSAQLQVNWSGVLSHSCGSII